VVLGVRADAIEAIVEGIKLREGAYDTADLQSEHLAELNARYLQAIWKTTGQPFPDDPRTQLWKSIEAVFESTNGRRARDYRELHGIRSNLPTAVTVQAMVFGNRCPLSGTGVAFTRNPATGAREFFGEYLSCAQGTDVVDGTRTPSRLRAIDRDPWEGPSLEELHPQVYAELENAAQRLEAHFADLQDIEFTIDQGKLWLLQTRPAKRSPAAAIAVAVDFVDEGKLSPEDAVRRIDPGTLEPLLHPSFDPASLERAHAEGRFLLRGLPASPGAVWGVAIFSTQAALERAQRGQSVVFVRSDTNADDVQAIFRARAIVTARGGLTSHSAVVARSLGKACVVGCAGMRVDEHQRRAWLDDGRSIAEGDILSVDGTTGAVYSGVIDSQEPRLGPAYERIMAWADGFRRLRVRANVDNPRDARQARALGAEGVGLCRTEHMFFLPERITAMRQMILASDESGRRAALERIRPMQVTDFADIFRAMRGLPCTIRLLDPPLHEFLPTTDQDVADAALSSGVPAEELRNKMELLREVNPALGHRGCRLGITFPEIYEMQVESILAAACIVSAEGGPSIEPEILIPLVATARELELVREVCTAAANRVLASRGQRLSYRIGTMIELPRAALTANELAPFADFLSMGTNDLTVTALGLSREDSRAFLPLYLGTGLYEADPFVHLDQGVAMLVDMAIQKARAVKPALEIGLCGEHGGESTTIARCHSLGVNYVSCSPHRIPVARLAAARAALAPQEASLAP
jgi:pyruvate,orthophosphate dikinase